MKTTEIKPGQIIALSADEQVIKFRPDQLFGAWAIEPETFARMVEQAKAVDINTLHAKAAKEEPTRDPGYAIKNGVSVIPISGPLTKYPTSFQSMFGGTSMVNAKKAVRESAAMYDSGKIKGIMLAIDSPGGTVAGTEELASEVARVAGTNCPIIAYIEDMGCSAAYWIASQADSIYANKTALVGNIGVLSVLKDTTGAYQQAGIKVIPVATGKYKGMGAEGTPITDEHVAEAQRLVNEMNLPFLDAVASGRGMTPKQLESVADGRAHVASTAKDMRLIDGISSFDSILERIHSMNADQFKAFAAENPEDQTVKDIHAKGFKAGAAQGLADARAKFTELQSAFPGRADFVIAQFSKGNDVLTAKGELADVLAGELKAKNEALATATADIAKMKANRGADPITGTTQAAASQADPVKVFNDKVAEAVKGGMTDAKAVNHVAKADPALYAEYLAAANAKATKAA